MTTFAKAVIAYLDQYRAAQKEGRFISVDPDGDGEKHAIFVSDDGRVNPNGDSTGKWKDYKPETNADENEKPEIKIKNVDLGIKAFEEIPARKNKDGTTRKNSRPDRRLAFGVKKAFKLDPTTGKKTNLDKRGFPIERSVAKFEDAAKEYGFPAEIDPTPQDIAELRKVAKEVQQQVNQERAEIVDAMRQLFADSRHGLSTWQSRARNAQDIRDLENFGIDRIISAQEYSDQEANLLPILATHAGLPPDSTTEDIVLAALQQPLPKPLALAHPDIVEMAGERLMSQGDEEYDEYEDDGRGIFGDYEPEDEPAPFQATSFADAVQHYASRDREKNGRFIAVDPDRDGEKHVIFVTDDGTINPRSKNPGKWKGYKAPKSKETPEAPISLKESKLFTESMEKARRKLQLDYGTEKIGQRGQSTGETRKTLNTYRKRLSTSGKLGDKAKPEEMTQIEYVADQLNDINDKRKQFLNAKNDLGKFLREAKKELSEETFGGASYRLLVKQTYDDLSQRDDSEKLLKYIDKRTNGGEPQAGYKNLLWLGADLSGNTSMFDYLQSDYTASGVLETLQSKHRENVRKAIQKDPSGAKARAYDEYFGAPWYPGNKAETQKAAVKYCKKVDEIKKGDNFRLNASRGRKYKKQANDAVEGMRKPWHKKFVDQSNKLHNDYREAVETMQEIGVKLRKADPDSEQHKQLRQEHEAALKLMDEIKGQNKVLSYEAKTALIDAIQKLPSNRRREPGKGLAISLENTRKQNGRENQALDSAVAWLEAVSGGAISSMNVKVLPTRDRRSFHSGGNIYMNKSQMDLPVLIHELGHAIDYSTNQHRFTKAFEAQAIQKQPTRWTGGGCKNDEVGSKNGFLDNYTGKYYDRPRSSEVMAMGLQRLYHDPVTFASESPDHFNFTVANIRGLLDG
jgi:hypothetical protein